MLKRFLYSPILIYHFNQVKKYEIKERKKHQMYMYIYLYINA